MIHTIEKLKNQIKDIADELQKLEDQVKEMENELQEFRSSPVIGNAIFPFRAYNNQCIHTWATNTGGRYCIHCRCSGY